MFGPLGRVATLSPVSGRGKSTPLGVTAPVGASGAKTVAAPSGRPAAAPVAAPAGPRRAGARPASPARRHPRPAPKVCHKDAECSSGTICERGECVVLKRPINIAYLFYRSGSRRYTSVLFLYHHRWGREGFRVLAPFYFHFWSPRSETRVVAPFYVSHENKKTHEKHWFFLNFHRFRGPRRTEFNIWPLLFTTSYRGKGFGFTLLPLFHYRRKGPQWSAYSILPIPWYFEKRRTEKRFFVLPFAGGVVGRKHTFVWSLPLNFYWRKGTRRSWLFLPLYFGRTDRGGTRHQSAVFPLFYYRRDKDRRQFVSLLASYFSNRATGKRAFVWHAPPLVFYRDPHRTVNVVFPFYFGYRNRAWHSAVDVVPPFVWYRDPKQQNAALLPLFYYFKDVRTGAYTTLLFPLFYQHRTQQGERLTVAGPFFLKRTRSGWHSGIFPALWFGSGRSSAHAVLFPLFFHYRDRRAKTTFTQAGPLYVTTGPKRWSFGLVPLLFAGRRPHGHHVVVFPLFWRRVRGDRAFTVAGPVYWWRRGDDRGHGVVPLYWFRRWYSRGGYVSSSLLLFPFLYHLNTPTRQMVVTPLGGWSEDRKRHRSTGVVLTAFWRRTPRSLTAGLFPFYGYHRDRVAGSTTHVFLPLNIIHVAKDRSSVVLFPFLFRFRRPTWRSLVVFPLYWRLRQRHGWNADVIFPLAARVWKGKRRILAIGPLYHEAAGDSARTRRFGIFPLLHVGWDRRTTYGHFLPLVFHYRNKVKGTGFTVAGPFFTVLRRKSRHSGVVPLAFWGHTGSKSYAVGFPLVWHFADAKRRASTTFVGPLFWHRRGNVTGGGLAPLLWVQRGPGRTQVTLFPLLHVERRPTRLRVWTPLFGFGWDRTRGTSHGYVGPVYWGRTRTGNSQVVFPLFWRFAKSGSSRTMVLFPLYFGTRSLESRFDVVFPFVWHRRTVTGRTWFIFPLWYDHKEYDESRTTALFPLFFQHRLYYKKDTTWMVAPSLYVRKRPHKLDVVLFPLFWHHRRPEGRSTTVLFPLYWDFARRGHRSVVGFPLYWDFKRPGRRATVVFPVFWRFRKGHEVRTLMLQSYLYQNLKKKTWQFLFLPFFEVARKRPGDFKFSLFGGFVSYERIGRNRILKLLWIPIRLKPTPGVSPPAARPAAARAATFYPL